MPTFPRKAYLLALPITAFVAVRSARADSNLTSHAKVAASSSSDFAPNALDDDWSTVWQADVASSQWLQID